MQIEQANTILERFLLAPERADGCYTLHQHKVLLSPVCPARNIYRRQILSWTRCGMMRVRILISVGLIPR